MCDGFVTRYQVPALKAVSDPGVVMAPAQASTRIASIAVGPPVVGARDDDALEPDAAFGGLEPDG